MIVERVLGIYIAVVGWAIIINPKHWFETLQEMRKNLPVDLIVGIISLLFGAVIVTVHNIWVLSPAMITTIIGWLALLKGFILLTIPSYMFQLTDRFYKSVLAIQAAGFIYFLLAAIILYYSF